MAGRLARALRGAFAAACVLLTNAVSTAQSACDADVNGDGVVNAADLSLVLSGWGACTGCAADVSGDAVVDGIDLSIVLGRWNSFCAPTIVAVTPASGPVAGGTPITIHGANLAGVVSVQFGSAAATSVAVVDASTVTAVTPAGTAGATSVSLATQGGVASLPGAFSYTAPWFTVLEQSPDSAIVPSAALRSAIIATGLPWRVRDIGTGIELLLVPPGSFNMGCSPSILYPCEADESPVHQVTLSNPFYIGRYEVTQAQWTARMGSNPSLFQGSAYPDAAQRPVERVSWNMIPMFMLSTGLRLPTEAEWEFAYRAGTTTAFHGFQSVPGGTADDLQLSNIAWFAANNGASGTAMYGTKPVGQKAANGLGLHDMAGNVFEWVQDWYGPGYYATSPSINPVGPASGTYRVARGGSWELSSEFARASYRGYITPGFTYQYFGFRVARSPG